MPEPFAAGRLALPLFGFVLGGNLGRPGALASGGYSRTARRLALFGSLAIHPFIALGGLGWGWWPFNIMATLLIITLCAWLIEVGRPARLALARVVLIVGGALASLYVINRNLWALAALPLIFAAGHIKLSVPRSRLGFYVC